ncbi:hypothetical protein ACFPOE_21995 [Caenimonas terrae]|uniref:DUF4145 domain-containing protein n=1 Tax=Caenimonas terrae TaxID=696074 RepID=A0ABW0NJP1_9BURK
MAGRQLETALELYFDNRDFYSVITLAAAADEIFGQVLRAAGQAPQLERIKEAVAAVHKQMWGHEADLKSIADRANRARNALKHWSEGQPMVVEFDAEEEAKDMLERAISNYWSLYKNLTSAMLRFQREHLRAA